MDSIREQVQSAIQKVIPLTKTLDQLGDKEDLRDAGMDSLNCIRLIIELEDHFDIQIPADKIGLASFKNIKDICELVAEASKK